MTLIIAPEKVFNFCIERPGCHAQCFAADWQVPAALPYFEGHFPGNPILPGVAIVDGTLELLRQGLRVDQLRLTQMKSAKFLGLVLPKTQVRIEIHQHKETEWDAEWKTTDESGVRVLAMLRFSILVKLRTV